jgi:hypothetical protein
MERVDYLKGVPMWWIAFVVLQIFCFFAGVRREQRAGWWSWSRFFFSLGFIGVEWLILMGTFIGADAHRRYFAAIVTAGSTVAVVNFLWFILAARRWKLPNGRTSLQVYCDKESNEV